MSIAWNVARAFMIPNTSCFFRTYRPGLLRSAVVRQMWWEPWPANLHRRRFGLAMHSPRTASSETSSIVGGWYCDKLLAWQHRSIRFFENVYLKLKIVVSPSRVASDDIGLRRSCWWQEKTRWSHHRRSSWRNGNTWSIRQPGGFGGMGVLFEREKRFWCFPVEEIACVI